jgi:hypothetical protein
LGLTRCLIVIHGCVPILVAYGDNFHTVEVQIRAEASKPLDCLATGVIDWLKMGAGPVGQPGLKFLKAERLST